MNVLITNIEFWSRSGTTVYVRDLALELKRQGHSPTVYAFSIGSIADELRAANIQVTATLSDIKQQPDIIHGHHYYIALDAIQYFRDVPAIYVCHDHLSPFDNVPKHQQLRRYFGVSRACLRRLIKEGVAPSDALPLQNFVDAHRFLPRAPLPKQPRKALIFSNYAHEGSQVPSVRTACLHAGLHLDVIGCNADTWSACPEQVLGQYDVVFAKAKAALEAMATGAAVVLCDFCGVGPMVTSARFAELRELNFGVEALKAPLAAQHVLAELSRYDPDDAIQVRNLVRTTADLYSATKKLVRIYQEVVGERPTSSEKLRATQNKIHIPRLRLKLHFAMLRAWQRLPMRFRRRLKTAPISRALIRTMKRLFVHKSLT